MKFRIWFALSFISFFSYSQFKISGIVRDSTKVIEFANVLLIDKSNKIISGTITDEKGKFLLESPKGEFVLSISFLGYKKKIMY